MTLRSLALLRTRWASFSSPNTCSRSTNFFSLHDQQNADKGASRFRKLKKHPKLYKSRALVMNSKKACLCASKKGAIKLPDYGNGCDFNVFLSHPEGTQSVINTKFLQHFELLDSNTYRCFLPEIKFLNFEAAPVIDLRVNKNSENCVVEMLSCKFQGSEIVERQNSHFDAVMTNEMVWYTNDESSLLEADVKLSLTLEIYTKPFSSLPTSVVERPGNLMMQALLDRVVPLLLEQLVDDYGKWALQRSQEIN